MVNIRRKMKRIIYVAVFCMCMTGAANAGSFSFKIMSKELGYNSAGIFNLITMKQNLSDSQKKRRLSL